MCIYLINWVNYAHPNTPCYDQVLFGWLASKNLKSLQLYDNIVVFKMFIRTYANSSKILGCQYAVYKKGNTYRVLDHTQHM